MSQVRSRRELLLRTHYDPKKYKCDHEMALCDRTLLRLGFASALFNKLESDSDSMKEKAMEELLELKTLLIQGNVSDALVLVEEMTEMSKDDKINKIGSYAKILLLHLIKRQAEKRTTRSWDLSIENSVDEIQKTNRRRKAGGTYLSPEELKETLTDSYRIALARAATEAFEGRYSREELGKMVECDRLIADALDLITKDLN